MKLLIIRHADPDYVNDSLTPTGWIEAELLAERLAKMDIQAFYVSPLGRAKATASLTLNKMNRKALECVWLREFNPKIKRPDKKEEMSIVWDWLPNDWTKEASYFDRAAWSSTTVMNAGQVRTEYEWVVSEFDKLLSSHGYDRESHYYRVAKSNQDIIVLFCHFGVQCVLLSHLLCVSPMVLWHGICAAPSSVTTLVTEERRKGVAYFRMGAFGDTSHLYAAGREPSFTARFCEVFESFEQRHD